MGRRGRKRAAAPPPEEDGPPRPPPPAEWMQQQAARIQCFGEHLSLDAARRYWDPSALRAYEHHRQAAASSGYLDEEAVLPPARVGTREADAVTYRQMRAWAVDLEYPLTAGLRPEMMSQTPREELHRLVAGKCVALGFCPSDRAVMVCGRPVVVPLRTLLRWKCFQK